MAVGEVAVGEVAVGEVAGGEVAGGEVGVERCWRNFRERIWNFATLAGDGK